MEDSSGRFGDRAHNRLKALLLRVYTVAARHTWYFMSTLASLLLLTPHLEVAPSLRLLASTPMFCVYRSIFTYYSRAPAVLLSAGLFPRGRESIPI